MSAPSIAEAVNTVSSFLAFEQVHSSSDLEHIWQSASAERQHSAASELPPTDVIVLCASAVLSTAETVFSTLAKCHSLREQEVSQNKHRIVLVLCGGLGHSTELMHQAVAAHPKYGVLAKKLSGQPEARILQAIGEKYFWLNINGVQSEDVTAFMAKDQLPSFSILIEDKSTNCGANAARTREVLETHGIYSPRSIVVSQDPTMCRRTIASFERVYSDKIGDGPRLFSWPTFVPTVATDREMEGRTDHDISSFLCYDILRMGQVDPDGLWTITRFLDLIMGEIPRLRDNTDGYGPTGKGFISHVDIPENVETAWQILDAIMTNSGRRR
ncbi:hypothetical protein L228DRAFT_261124 [Xylona heveae TC161]|uniref:Uncharacterized protein n=1 Tax=Xylona heveae (strain CBS 132557 / TC161) TaxID=1328760 RepID=A0A165H5N0_XYLHT|nr:hypothetical protein L228DRAFT_261124 [Xylona heveae TC161]KZF23019.1 hypothetical protein L228DRAFT_261124 [Xylona heveae TC161]